MTSTDRTQDLLNGIGPGFCLAKWLQTTVYLQNGYNHSCHHPSPHKVPLSEITENHKALHNTQFKKQQMQLMLDGGRPKECEYCWKIEDLGKNYISDRVYKSSNDWAITRLGEILENTTADIEPGYLEVSFSNVCNLKCVYCSPEISSSWYKEIERFGGYPTSSNFNGFQHLKDTGRMPYDPNGENPYVDAFWKWWPDLYPVLHTLRLTGGEPLLSRDVWQLIDYLIANPNPKLTFCINSNLCVQDDIIDKFIYKMNQLIPNVKELQIFSSGESTGSHGEYIRNGLNYERWLTNMHKVASQCENIILANMTTDNILCVPTFVSFIDNLLDMRREYNKTVSHCKIQFMVNFLRYPSFLALPNLDIDTKNEFSVDINDLIKRRSDILSNEEIDQLNRLVDYMYTTDSNKKNNRKDFKIFINEADIRRHTNFTQTFPQLQRFYKLCPPI